MLFINEKKAANSYPPKADGWSSPPLATIFFEFLINIQNIWFDFILSMLFINEKKAASSYPPMADGWSSPPLAT